MTRTVEPQGLSGGAAARDAPARPLRTALGWMQLSRAGLLRAVLLGSLGTGSAVALLGVSGWLIARASQHPPVLDLSVAVVSVRALGISRAVFRYVERLASHEVALRGLVGVRERLFRELAAADPHRVARLRRGELLARFGADVDRLADVVVTGVLPFCVAAVVGAASVLAAALVLPAAGLALLVALVLAGVLGPWLAARGARAAHVETLEARGRVAAGVAAHVSARDELLVAGRLAHSRERLRGFQREQSRAEDRAAGPAAAAAALQLLATAVALVPALLLGSQAVASGQIGEVMLAVLVLLPLGALEACAALPAAAGQLVLGQAAAGRIMQLAGEKRTASTVVPPSHTRDAEPDVLRTTDLVVGWDHPLDLPPLSVELRPGRLVAITGPSGVGKTTLAMTLAGLLPPVAGSVRLGGEPLGAVADLPRRVCFTAHDGHVFGTSLRENLLVAAAEGTGDDALRTALERVGLRDWLARLPDGLDTRLRSGGGDLSGGERRRLLLARALLTGAALLVVDEPTEHLDPASALQVLDDLHALAHSPGGPGICLLTHELEVPADLSVQLTTP